MTTARKRLAIVIPAYNEEQRIGKTLRAYGAYSQLPEVVAQIDTQIIVVMNGCKDNTQAVVEQAQREFPSIVAMTNPVAGKGLAVIAGFKAALADSVDANHLIGFVDADMATAPRYFYELVGGIEGYDAAVASRYMPGSQVLPPRPWIKRMGGEFFYNRKVRRLFGLNLYDYQCGAKLFRAPILAALVDHMTETQWAFDVELLYLVKVHGGRIHEIPTVWHDQEGSKLATFSAGIKMLKALDSVYQHHTAGKV